MTRGRIVIDVFTTLDGVAQGPGAPDEDTSNGFRWGGWQAPIPDSMVGEQVNAYIASMDAMLLGRRTYDIFAGYWPLHTDGPSGHIGRTFDALPKYVASRTDFAPQWTGTTRLGDDVVTEVDALRDAHAEIHVIGSIDFSRTLLETETYDELRLWVHPIVLGEGKKVFPEGAAAARLRLIEPAITGDHGVVQLRYAPAGEPTTGTMED